MKLEDSTIKRNCPSEEIFLYLEGELSATEESALESHLADCELCSTEFNSQKKLAQALNLAFEKENEVELPKDFTKIVITNAESNVRGLRSVGERSTAIFICCALFLVLAFGFWSETENLFANTNGWSKQIFALFSSIGHFIYDISIGFVVVLRSLSQQITVTPIYSIIVVLGFTVFSFLAFSRLKLKLSRS